MVRETRSSSVKVDLALNGNLTTQDAAGKITQALQRSADGFVINMSFAIVPCDPASIAELQGADGVKNARVYIEKLIKDSNLPGLEDFKQLLADLDGDTKDEKEKVELVRKNATTLGGAAYSPLVDQTKDGTRSGLPGLAQEGLA